MAGGQGAPHTINEQGTMNQGLWLLTNYKCIICFAVAIGEKSLKTSPTFGASPRNLLIDFAKLGVE